jgi:enamine deaminase RidA (YjgF/YER057c/UK114 family)
VGVQAYLTNAATFERMNKVHMNYFKNPRPTRTTVVVARLIGLGQIQITATARK